MASVCRVMLETPWVLAHLFHSSDTAEVTGISKHIQIQTCLCGREMTFILTIKCWMCEQSQNNLAASCISSWCIELDSGYCHKFILIRTKNFMVFFFLGGGVPFQRAVIIFHLPHVLTLSVCPCFLTNLNYLKAFVIHTIFLLAPERMSHGFLTEMVFTRELLFLQQSFPTVLFCTLCYWWTHGAGQTPPTLSSHGKKWGPGNEGIHSAPILGQVYCCPPLLSMQIRILFPFS